MTYAQFWLRYLQAHARPETRALHYFGSVLALAALALTVVLADWRWLIAAPLVGYGFAWAAHFGIEHNKPETFGHPLWSLASDYRMSILFLTGRLRPHLVDGDDERLRDPRSGTRIGCHPAHSSVSRKAGRRSRARILGAMPPPRKTPPVARIFRARLAASAP